MKPGDGETRQIPVPEVAVCAARALAIGDVANKRAETSTNGQIGCSGRLCLFFILKLHLYFLPPHPFHQQGISPSSANCHSNERERNHLSFPANIICLPGRQGVCSGIGSVWVSSVVALPCCLTNILPATHRQDSSITSISSSISCAAGEQQ